MWTIIAIVFVVAVIWVGYELIDALTVPDDYDTDMSFLDRINRDD